MGCSKNNSEKIYLRIEKLQFNKIFLGFDLQKYVIENTAEFINYQLYEYKLILVVL